MIIKCLRMSVQQKKANCFIMKGTATFLSSAKRLSVKWCLSLMTVALFSIPVFSQTVTPEQEVGDLSKIKWVDNSSIAPVLNQEKTRMDVALSPATVAPDEAALYKAYKRMLDYLNTNLQAGKAVDASILEAYEKVLAEAGSDPELKYMPQGVLATYIPGLVEILTVPIKAETAN